MQKHLEFQVVTPRTLAAFQGAALVLPDIRMLDEAERRLILVSWNDSRTDYPRERTVHELFEEQVDRAPDAIALSRSRSPCKRCGMGSFMVPPLLKELTSNPSAATASSLIRIGTFKLPTGRALCGSSTSMTKSPFWESATNKRPS